MLSRNAAYDMDTALNEIKEKEMMLDTRAETQLILQLLVAKGIVTREEVAEMRAVVKRSPKYKPMYDYLEQAKKKAEQYRENPQEHLKDLFAAKLNGKFNRKMAMFDGNERK